MFEKRLLKYRSSHNLKMREMADQLDLSESYYSLVESGKRSPSKKVIQKLATISELPEEYWIYGIDIVDYLNYRDEFKSLRKALNAILEFNTINDASDIFDANNKPKDALGKLIIAALKADLNYFIKEKQK